MLPARMHQVITHIEQQNQGHVSQHRGQQTYQTASRGRAGAWAPTSSSACCCCYCWARRTQPAVLLPGQGSRRATPDRGMRVVAPSPGTAPSPHTCSARTRPRTRDALHCLGQPHSPAAPLHAHSVGIETEQAGQWLHRRERGPGVPGTRNGRDRSSSSPRTSTVRSASLCNVACLVALVGVEETSVARQRTVAPASVRPRRVPPAAVPRAQRSAVCPASPVPHRGRVGWCWRPAQGPAGCGRVEGARIVVTGSQSHLLHYVLLLLHVVVLLVLLLVLLLRGVYVGLSRHVWMWTRPRPPPRVLQTRDQHT